MALEELLLCYPGYPGVKVILSGHNAGAGAGSRSLVAMNARKWPLVIRSLRHRGIFSVAGSHGDRSPDRIRKWRPVVIDLESIKSNHQYCIQP